MSDLKPCGKEYECWDYDIPDTAFCCRPEGHKGRHDQGVCFEDASGNFVPVHDGYGTLATLETGKLRNDNCWPCEDHDDWPDLNCPTCCEHVKPDLALRARVHAK